MMKLTERKRENTVDAAIQEFREHGFLGAKTTRIAKRAGVSSRTLYNHFETKEALFDAVSEILLERHATSEPVDYDPSVALEQQLTQALTRYVEALTDETAIGLNRMVMSEMLRDLERAQRFFAETACHDNPVTGLVAQAMEAGALRWADPMFATQQLLAMVKNFYFWPVFFLDQRTDTDEPMAQCVAMFLSFYGREDN